MLEISIANKDHWCDSCDRLIPKGYQHWAGSRVTMVGIIPLVEYIREHKDCSKFVKQIKKDNVVPSEA